MFMGFILHIYIIFETNLLTGGPTRIAVFCLFQCFEEKEYQTESKRNETFGSVIFGTNVIQRTWSGSQETKEVAMRVPSVPPIGGRAPTLVGPSSVHRPTSSSYIYPCTPKTSEATTKYYFHCRNLLYPRDPILEPSPVLRQRGNRPRRASTSSPRPFRSVVSSLPQTFGSIVIS